MIKIAYCDDDVSILNEVGAWLERYGERDGNQEIEYFAFSSPLDMMSEIEKGVCYDILFLDIIMPGQNGVDTAKEIRKYDSEVKIIFLTSSKEFAVESYMVKAYFYQVKPIREELFCRLMDSVIEECEKGWLRGMLLQGKNGIIRIDLDKLEYCEVIGHVLFFHMRNGKVIENVGNLDELCAKLAKFENFLRLHRSFLINLDFVQNISHRKVVMNSLSELPIPHGKCSELKNRYMNYMFSSKQVFLS